LLGVTSSRNPVGSESETILLLDTVASSGSSWRNGPSRHARATFQKSVSIDRRFGFIRRWTATDAAAYEGRRLRQGLLDKSNTASGVWADTAYRSAANEMFLTKNGFLSHIHRKKPKGRAMSATMPACQQCEIENPRARRACVRRAKGPDEVIHHNDWYRPSDDQDRNGQSGLEHQTPGTGEDVQRTTGIR
jgi:hypothetical protein